MFTRDLRAKILANEPSFLYYDEACDRLIPMIPRAKNFLYMLKDIKQADWLIELGGVIAEEPGSFAEHRADAFFTWMCALSMAHTEITLDKEDPQFFQSYDIMQLYAAIDAVGVLLINHPTFSLNEVTKRHQMLHRLALYLVAYDRNGRRSYQVTPQMMQKLVDTTWEDIDIHTMDFPSDAFFVHHIPYSAGNFYEDSDHPTCMFVLVSDENNMKRVDIQLICPGRNENIAIEHTFFEIHERVNLPNLFNRDSMPSKQDGLLVGRLFHWLCSFCLYVSFPGAKTKMQILDSEAKQLWDRASRLPAGSSKKKQLLERYYKLHPKRTILVG